MNEIIKVVGGKGDGNEIEAWQEVVDEIDKDGNGEIKFQEFKQMMLLLAYGERWLI